MRADMDNEKSRVAIVLLAEDDLGDQKLARRAFKDSGIANDLRIVGNGEEALDYLLRRGAYEDPKTSPRPDLLLLDLNMPKVDGREVLEEMNRNPDCPNIATVVFTTSKQEEDIAHSYDLNVKSYITKPLEYSSFVETIKLLSQYWFNLIELPPRDE
jgi:CheY-like chemotaxis protein